MNTLIIIGLWAVGMGVIYYLLTSRSQASLARERMMVKEADQRGEQDVEPRGSYIGEWLVRSGFRAAGSTTAFVIATLLCTLVGGVLGLVLAFTSVLDFVQAQASGFAPGTGGMTKVALAILPWGIFVALSITPWLYVRGKRHKRVEDIERELPVILELLATLSESGLGFDASFAKILESDQEPSTLIQEFKGFQAETMAGISRIRCFRRLTRRCEVSSMTVFCSALIQAEQIGSGFSSVLRTQATDLREQRRNRAMIKAHSLPVKLVFPLVICFLPGIFVVTLGPAFMEFFELAAGVMKGG
ncbi:MAG: tight adherence protein C [Candidatus Paceibacteria bacterium]|jgi:tight adherence protein C